MLHKIDEVVSFYHLFDYCVLLLVYIYREVRGRSPWWELNPLLSGTDRKG